MSDLECNELANDQGGTASDPCVGVGGLFCSSEDWHSWDGVIEEVSTQLLAANALIKSQAIDPESAAGKQAQRVQIEIVTWITLQKLRPRPPSDPEAFVKGLAGMIVYNRPTRKARDSAVRGCKLLGRAAAVLEAAGAGEQGADLDAQLHQWSELGKLMPRGLSWKAWTVIGLGGASLITFGLWRVGLLSRPPPRRRAA